MAQVATVYDRVGGQAFFDALVDRFYDAVAADPPLLALYPTPEDLTDARRHLALFLGQYWGGPTTYSQQRGHPRLRMRHAPFAIDVDARDRWLAAMTAALDAAELDPDVRQAFDEYFAMAAESMRNQFPT
jgi:hemoglobin